MQKLRSYIKAHTQRVEKPGSGQTTVDMILFQVAVNGSSQGEFRRMTNASPGIGGSGNPLDGNEYPYPKLENWLGDRDLAVRYMALGKALGVFGLTTPRDLGMIDEILTQMFASMGVLAIKAVS